MSKERAKLASYPSLSHWPASVLSKLERDAALGKSLWILGPRYVGKTRAVLYLLDYVRQVREATPVLIDRPNVLDSGEPDWQGIWNLISRRVRVSPVISVHDMYQLSSAVIELLASSSQLRLAIGLIGCRKGLEHAYYQVGSALHSIVQTAIFEEGVSSDRLQVLIPDEYSLWYHEKLKGKDGSDWRVFHSCDVGFASKDDIMEIWQRHDIPITQGTAETILNVTGGHIGLLGELLVNCPSDLCTKRMKQQIRSGRMLKILASSRISGVMMQVLEREPRALRLATNFRSAIWIDDFGSPFAQMLLRYGILRKLATKSKTAILSGESVVRILDEALEKAPLDSSIASPMLPLGLCTMGASRTEDDVVVLHISDLHVGPQHHWRLPEALDEFARNLSNLPLAELVRDDLEFLGLLESVDLLVITGDLTEVAAPGEFYQARLLIQKLLEYLGLDRDQVLVVPGNHDLSFSPDSANPKRNIASASDLSFINFQKLLCGSDGGSRPYGARSKSGRLELQCVPISSCSATGPQTPELGFVEPDSLQKWKALLGEWRPKDPAGTADTCTVARLLCLHHHVVPVVSQSLPEALKKNPPSVLINSPEVLSWAIDMGFVGVLHGHHHQPFVTRFQRWTGSNKREFKALTVAGAGSCGVRREHLDAFGHHHYFIHIIGPERWWIRSRTTDAEGHRFVTHEDLEVPLQ